MSQNCEIQFSNKFIRRTGGCTRLDYKNNFGIQQEITGLTGKKYHFLGMPLSRISLYFLCNQPKGRRSLGRPFKR
jgi:hypothetical protein